MPLFGNKFSPKKTPPRKIVSFSEDAEKVLNESSEERDKVRIVLSDNEISFERGNWSVGNGKIGDIQKENLRLHKQIERLEEENNMLLLKFEVLLNLCTQTTAESHFKDREIEKLRKNLVFLENR